VTDVRAAPFIRDGAAARWLVAAIANMLNTEGGFMRLMRTMRTVLEHLGGLWALFMLAAKSRFRMNNAYWKWRRETAFGSDPARWPSRHERRKAMLAYGRWVHRMKRSMK